MIGALKTNILNLNKQIQSYEQIFNEKTRQSKCGVPFCDGKGHINGASSSHRTEKTCPNQENKPYINMIENLRKQLENLQIHNIALSKTNLDLKHLKNKGDNQISSLMEENKQLKKSHEELKKKSKLFMFKINFVLLILNHSNFKVNSSLNELHSVTKSNENILMLNDQLQKKIDDLNQSNQELSNLNREYKNLGSTYQKENEEIKSMSMKFFL